MNPSLRHLDKSDVRRFDCSAHDDLVVAGEGEHLTGAQLSVYAAVVKLPWLGLVDKESHSVIRRPGLPDLLKPPRLPLKRSDSQPDLVAVRKEKAVVLLAATREAAPGHAKATVATVL